MGEASALRRARGAGRVDDLGDVVGRDVGKWIAGSRALTGRDEHVPIVEEHVLAQRRQPGPGALQLGEQVGTAVLALQEDSGGSGAGQDVPRFGRVGARG